MIKWLRRLWWQWSIPPTKFQTFYATNPETLTINNQEQCAIEVLNTVSILPGRSIAFTLKDGRWEIEQ